MSVDPLAEKYFPLSPYNYVSINPLIFIDSDVRIIDLSKFLKHHKKNQEHSDVLVNDLASKTGLTLSIKDGKLVYEHKAKTNRKGTSSKARRELKKTSGVPSLPHMAQVRDLCQHSKDKETGFVPVFVLLVRQFLL